MKLWCLFLLFWLASTPVALAFTVVPVAPTAPHEPYVVSGSPATERMYLGTLTGFPDVYEVTSAQPFTLVLKLAAVPDPNASPELSVIIVAVNELGVAEVDRLAYADTTWEPVRQPITGLTQLAGPGYEADFEAGTYRIEISSLDNLGKYILTLGSEFDEAGYFATLRSIKQVYDFYGASTFGMIRSPYVHYPIGIIILLGLIAATYRWRKYY